MEASHICKTAGCAAVVPAGAPMSEVHLCQEGSRYNSSRNVCNTIHCTHNPKCFMLPGTSAAASHHHSPSPAAAEPSPSKSQLKEKVRMLEREVAAAVKALKEAQESTPPPGERKRAREEESPAVTSAEKRARGLGMFPKGFIASPSM